MNVKANIGRLAFAALGGVVGFLMITRWWAYSMWCAAPPESLMTFLDTEQNCGASIRGTMTRLRFRRPTKSTLGQGGIVGTPMMGGEWPSRPRGLDGGC